MTIVAELEDRARIFLRCAKWIIFQNNRMSTKLTTYRASSKTMTESDVRPRLNERPLLPRTKKNVKKIAENEFRSI